MIGLFEPQGIFLAEFGPKTTVDNVNRMCKNFRILLETLFVNKHLQNGKAVLQSTKQDAINLSKVLSSSFFRWKTDSMITSAYYSEYKDLESLQDYSLESAKTIREEIFEALKTESAEHKEDFAALFNSDKDKYWDMILRKAETHQKKGLYSTVRKYRELEQARFLYEHIDRLHPDLLEEVTAVLDSIFAVRLPPLLTILAQYSQVEDFEQQLYEDSNSGDDDDDEDFLDEPDLVVEPKKMSDLELETYQDLDFDLTDLYNVEVGEQEVDGTVYTTLNLVVGGT